MNERDKLATDNIKLAYYIANQFRGYCDKYGVTIEDLNSIATIGLMKAVDKYISSKGKFGSFASPYIRGELQHYFRDGKGNLIRNKRGDSAQFVRSLDTLLKDDTNTTLLDTVADNRVEEINYDNSFIEDYQYYLARLPWQEADSLQMHLNGLTNKDISEWLEINPMKVTRLISDATVRIKYFSEQDPNKKVIKYKRNRNALPHRNDEILVIPEFKSKCVVCGKIFGMYKRTINRKPLCCNGTCSKALANQKKDIGGKTWSHAELDLLDSLVGTMPRIKLIEYFRLEFPRRTFNAVKVKLTRRYQTIKATKNNWNMKKLATMLDIPVDRIRVWERAGLIVGKCNRIRTISREAINEFCFNQYARFYGIDPINLSKIIDDPKLVDLCSQMPKIVKRTEYQRLDNKQVYKSLREASRQLKMSRSTIVAITRHPDGWIKKSTVLT